MKFRIWYALIFVLVFFIVFCYELIICIETIALHLNLCTFTSKYNFDFARKEVCKTQNYIKGFQYNFERREKINDNNWTQKKL